MKTHPRPSGLFVALFALSGCLASPLNPDQAPTGHSVEFQSGYRDGCSTARYEANNDAHNDPITRTSDTDRYRSVADYRAGWDLGHTVCFKDEQLAPMPS